MKKSQGDEQRRWGRWRMVVTSCRRPRERTWSTPLPPHRGMPVSYFRPSFPSPCVSRSMGGTFTRGNEIMKKRRPLPLRQHPRSLLSPSLSSSLIPRDGKKESPLSANSLAIPRVPLVPSIPLRLSYSLLWFLKRIPEHALEGSLYDDEERRDILRA